VGAEAFCVAGFCARAAGAGGAQASHGGG